LIQSQTPLGKLQIHITQEEGLPDHYIKNITSDNRGFVWITTTETISRFDGTNVEVLDSDSLPSNHFSTIVIDTTRNNLWAASSEGLFKVDLISSRVTKFAPIDFDENSLPDIFVNNLFLDFNGRLWICTADGLAYMDLDTEKIFRVPCNISSDKIVNEGYKYIHSIIQDPSREEIYWISTSNGLIKYDLNSLKTVSIESNLAVFDGFYKFRNLYIDEINNHIYAVVLTRVGLNKPYDYVVFDPVKESFIHGIKVNDNWVGTTVHSKSPNKMWLSSLDGVAEYDLLKKEVTGVYTNPVNASISYGIDHIDGQGRIWSGNQNGVFAYYDEVSQSENYYYKTDIPNSYHVVSDLHFNQARNEIYLSVFGGEGIYIHDLNTQKWRIDKPHQKIDPDSEIYTGLGFRKSKDGRLYTYDDHHLYELKEDGSFYPAPNIIDPNDIGTLLEAIFDSDNNLWIYSIKGLYKVDLQTSIKENLINKVDQCKEVKGSGHLYEDRNGNIWFSGHCQGFSVFIKRENKFYYSNQIVKEDFVSEEIYPSILENSDTIYLLAESAKIIAFDINNIKAGLAFNKDLKKNVFEDRSISISSGHADMISATTGAAFDADGNYWMESPQGLIKYDLKNTIEIFNESNDITLKCREMNVYVAGNMTLLPDHRFIYSTRKGIHFFNPKTIGQKEIFPKPYIKGFYINNEMINSDTIANAKVRYELKPGQNFLSIEFASVNFNRKTNTKYAYQLVGIDEDWVETKERNFASYTNLNGGFYNFILKARNENGDWNPDVLNLEITINTKWWKTWYARVGFVLFVVGLGYLIYRERIRQIVEKQKLINSHEKKLAEIKMNALTAQMNPHFIFNSLNSIDYFIIKNNSEKASDYLNRFSRLIRLILNHSRSNYISLKDDLDALKLYIEIESLRFSDSFDYIVRVDKDLNLDNIQIPPMIFQPYVENAIWHGLMHKETKGRIEIDLKLNPTKDILLCTISDNGVGRQKAEIFKSKTVSRKEKKSMGMQIIKDKLDVINFLHDLQATVEVKDLSNKNGKVSGTQVFLKIPI
jgi:ligand-binding sensor domain-containing protein